ncbi:MAG: hypothetical protein NT031_16040 [Planctomycetota bacterium]|nr:hypothetical protein [Planctomycetota bacterium]
MISTLLLTAESFCTMSSNRSIGADRPTRLWNTLWADICSIMTRLARRTS